MPGLPSTMASPTASSAPRRRPTPTGIGTSATPSVGTWCIGSTSTSPWSAALASPGTAKPSPPAPSSPWNGRFWMAYSALRRNENPPTRKVHRVGLAVSDDLYTWTKYAAQSGQRARPAPLRTARSLSTRPTANGAIRSCSSPMTACISTCAPAASPRTRHRRGTVGLASSRDMRTWRVEPPLHVDPIATELEVPQVYRIGGRYYLLFCTSTDRLLPAFKRRFPGHRWRPRQLLDGWELAARTVPPVRHRRGPAPGRSGPALREPPRPVARAVGAARHGQHRRHPLHL